MAHGAGDLINVVSIINTIPTKIPVTKVNTNRRRSSLDVQLIAAQSYSVVVFK
eukprot:m.13996 g.13996  ORF g.13996 m.13996 type:complete len:53 (+) comp6092_c0_seq1:2456-2614(+)